MYVYIIYAYSCLHICLAMYYVYLFFISNQLIHSYLFEFSNELVCLRDARFDEFALCYVFYHTLEHAKKTLKQHLKIHEQFIIMTDE